MRARIYTEARFKRFAERSLPFPYRSPKNGEEYTANAQIRFLRNQLMEAFGQATDTSNTNTPIKFGPVVLNGGRERFLTFRPVTTNTVEVTSVFPKRSPRQSVDTLAPKPKGQ